MSVLRGRQRGKGVHALHITLLQAAFPSHRPLAAACALLHGGLPGPGPRAAPVGRRGAVRNQQLHRGGAKGRAAGQRGGAGGGVQRASALAAHAHARARIQQRARALQVSCTAAAAKVCTGSREGPPQPSSLLSAWHTAASASVRQSLLCSNRGGQASAQCCNRQTEIPEPGTR